MNAELRVRKTIKDCDMIRRGDIVVLGISGGPDSLCLLNILHAFQRSFGFTLRALHMNHLMRGEGATRDVEFLEGICGELNVPLKVVECDVYAKAEEERISPEEAGRKARHEALAAHKAELEKSVAPGGRARVLTALAHNRDDQAETVLMRVIRGTGVHGIAAMEYVREDGLIRPLLDTPRSEIEKYCAKKGLSPRWDYTNADPAYTRNKLRMQLIPLIEADYNPNIKETLARLAESAREDDSFLEGLAQKACEDYDGRFPVRELAAMDAAIAKRVIKIMFFKAGLVEDIAYAHINSLLAAARGRRSGKLIEFPRGFRGRITRDYVLFEREEQA